MSTELKRASAEQVFMEIVATVAKRSTCLSRHVGAIIVKDGHILGTGYNGAPRKVVSCLEKGVCLRLGTESGKKLEYCMAAHAELNSIVQSAYHGIQTEGAILYCTFSPCSFCAKAIINAGIKEVVFSEYYTDELGTQLLTEANIKMRKYEHLEK